MSQLKIAIAGCALYALPACSDAKEAESAALLLVTDAGAFRPITTDLGYQVELASARVVVEDLQFAIAGEEHSSLRHRVYDWLVPVAHAHPGHFQGGDVTGELAGHFVLSYIPGETRDIGTATLLLGTYRSVNFTLAVATTEDVKETDPLLGHTAVLRGTASNAVATVDFEVVVDSPAERQITGVPFEEKVTRDTPKTLALRLSPADELEGDTLFDGVDFAALTSDADERLLIAPNRQDDAVVAAYHQIQRALQSHDHFKVEPQR